MKYKYVLTNSASIRLISHVLMPDLRNSSGRVTWVYGSCHVNRESACFEKQKQNVKLYHINYKE
jgi:hypothetical protein